MLVRCKFVSAHRLVGSIMNPAAWCHPLGELVHVEWNTQLTFHLTQLMDNILHRFELFSKCEEDTASPETHSKFNIEQDRSSPDTHPSDAPKSCTGGSPPMTESQH